MNKMKTLLAALSMSLTLTPAAFAQSQPASGTGRSNPTFEITTGVDGPMHQAAEFPGLSLSLAFLIPRGDRFGFGIVTEVDLAYLRPAHTGGVRIYKRSGSLSAGNQTTVFAQFTAGTTKRDDEGIFHSNAVTVIQPGVGLIYGGLRRALHIQIDYRHVPDELITRSGKVGDPVTTEPSLPKYRILIGYTWRLRAR